MASTLYYIAKVYLMELFTILWHTFPHSFEFFYLKLVSFWWSMTFEAPSSDIAHENDRHFFGRSSTPS